MPSSHNLYLCVMIFLSLVVAGWASPLAVRELSKVCLIIFAQKKTLKSSTPFCRSSSFLLHPWCIVSLTAKFPPNHFSRCGTSVLIQPGYSVILLRVTNPSHKLVTPAAQKISWRPGIATGGVAMMLVVPLLLDPGMCICGVNQLT
ncbi:hypothetical protein DFS33DRAFT_800023 [Desarmillaria ectypa]|nr:hypothetical protein DFS33DRAFT_800023 [Desarmillaria ectypa]